jgi:hypothetical protein
MSLGPCRDCMAKLEHHPVFIRKHNAVPPWPNNSKRPLKIKKAPIARSLFRLGINPGGDLRSRAVTRAVSSALQGLTSVFGMGTGVTLAVRPPGNLNIEIRKSKLEARIGFTRVSNFECRVSMINRRKQANRKFHLKVMQCGKDCLTLTTRVPIPADELPRVG